MRLIRVLATGLVMLVTAGCGGESAQSTSSGPVGTSTRAAATKEEERRSEHFTIDNWYILASDIDPDAVGVLVNGYPARGADQFAHKGASVDVIGEIVGQRRGDADRVFFWMSVDSAGSEIETFVTSWDTSLRVSAGDHVRVRGEVIEAVGEGNAVHQEFWFPHVLASDVEVVEG